LVTPRASILLTDSRYTEQALGECLGCRIIERKKTITEALAEEAKRLGKLRRLAVEKTISVGTLLRIRRALHPLGIAVVCAEAAVEQLRLTKNPAEIQTIRQAARIAWECLDAALKNLRTGMTEQQLTAHLEYEMRMRGVCPGFETIIAFGSNGSRNHHQPSSRKLRARDTLLIDFGVRLNGYTCDITRSFGFGQVSRKYQKAWEAVYAAQQAAIAELRDGVLAAEVDAAAREAIRRSGFPVYGHGTGHGLGLEVHEMPYLTPLDKKTRLKAGQIITIEPGIYLPGHFGIRIEDDVLITKTGAEVLTADRRTGYSTGSLLILKGRS
jgi:Xaa-Pro aminopeptidase